MIGCALDLYKKEMQFYVDGKPQGPAFTGFTVPSDGLVPAVSLARSQRVRVNFGKSDFAFPIHGHMAVHSNLGDGLKKLDKLFEKYKGTPPPI